MNKTAVARELVKLARSLVAIDKVAAGGVDFYVERNAVRVYAEIPEGASSREKSLAGKEVKAKTDEIEDALRQAYDDIFLDSTGRYRPPKFKRIPYETEVRGRGYVGILLEAVGGTWFQEVVKESIARRYLRASKNLGV